MVKRYVPIDQWGQVLAKCMDEDEEGPYVLASDYDALTKEFAAAKALLDEAYGHLRYSTADLEARIYKLLAGNNP